MVWSPLLPTATSVSGYSDYWDDREQPSPLLARPEPPSPLLPREQTLSPQQFADWQNQPDAIETAPPERVRSPLLGTASQNAALHTEKFPEPDYSRVKMLQQQLDAQTHAIQWPIQSYQESQRRQTEELRQQLNDAMRFTDQDYRAQVAAYEARNKPHASKGYGQAFQGPGGHVMQTVFPPEGDPSAIDLGEGTLPGVALQQARGQNLLDREDLRGQNRLNEIGAQGENAQALAETNTASRERIGAGHDSSRIAAAGVRANAPSKEKLKAELPGAVSESQKARLKDVDAQLADTRKRATYAQGAEVEILKNKESRLVRQRNQILAESAAGQPPATPQGQRVRTYNPATGNLE